MLFLWHFFFFFFLLYCGFPCIVTVAVQSTAGCMCLCTSLWAVTGSSFVALLLWSNSTKPPNFVPSCPFLILWALHFCWIFAVTIYCLHIAKQCCLLAQNLFCTCTFLHVCQFLYWFFIAVRSLYHSWWALPCGQLKHSCICNIGLQTQCCELSSAFLFLFFFKFSVLEREICNIFT